MTQRQFLILAATAAVFAVAYGVRFLWVENAALGFACTAEMTPACAVRQAFILGFHWKLYGAAAVVLGGVALWRPRAVPTALALATSALALVFYNIELGALGGVLALSALARMAPDCGAGRSAAG